MTSPSPSAESVKSWLVQRLASLCDVDTAGIDVEERLIRLGLDSIGAVRLIAELSEVVGRRLSPTLVWEAPTIAALVNHLTGNSTTIVESHPVEPHDLAEPIAIVGMACKFPGAENPAAFWKLLRDGVDAITKVPEDRWDAAAFFDRDPSVPGKINTSRGGFVDQIDMFDSQFFEISPREAAQMDPQQRLMLELAWRALEDAGIPPVQLVGSRTGVFIGALFTDYGLLQDRAGGDTITPYTCSGATACIIANRISYTLGLQGPSLTLDTACSSSLVTVHLACQSLRSGESDAALAGGVNLMLIPERTVSVTKLGALSPDGRCRAFSADANGFVRSEGGGVVVLKRLSDALRAGDMIYSVVRGSAVNNDGASNGLTAPNPIAQQAVLRDACRNAGLAPSELHYVEAHGTGTPLGDPIEAAALGAVYGTAEGRSGPLLIGSAKANVGHLEAAAGVVGLIKVALAMRHDLLPPSLHFDPPNPRIDFDGLHLEVITQIRPWPAPGDTPRRAGVSSFGYGGTNSHVIMESLPAPFAAAALVGEHSSETRDAVWVFSGQGSQWAGMGRRLVLAEPAFRSSLAHCDRALHRHPGSRGGVFVGVMYDDYASRLTCVSAEHEGYLGIGSASSVASGRIAYSLGLQGPAISVDTACSSSLVSMHLAAQALRRGECSLALAGGVTVMATPATFVGFSRQRALSSDGRCKAFSAAADGTGWAEGVGMVVLERLSDARRHGHPVLALLKGSATNQDGKSQGLTAPNGPAQEAVILQALADARLSPEDVDAIEAHGTGTRLGDPIEAQALLATYGAAHSAERPVWLGSLKSNIGHAQAAAGVGGVIKMVMALQHGFLPRTLHAETPSPFVDWSSGSLRLLNEARPWETTGRPRRAGVSSFGVSGSNAHVILEEAPAAGAVQADVRVTDLVSLPFVLSAKSEASLRGQAERLREHLRAHDDLSLVDVAYSLATTRSRFEQRTVVVAKDRGGLLDALDAVAEGRAAAHAVSGRATGGKVVFVFPGQGSQWEGMALALLEASPVFRAEMEACERALAPHVEWSLMAVLRGEGDATLDGVDVVQPTLFAVMVSLAALWRSVGIAPDAVIGHSQGEIAAAYVAGALSLEDAAKIVAVRSRVLRQLAGKGGMAAVELGVEALQERLARFENRLSVAAVNSPQATLVSGDPEAIDALLEELEKAQIFARKIRVDYASHCAAVEEVRTRLLEELGTMAPAAGRVPLYSTVTGERIDGETLDAGYWYRNLRQTVRFADAVETLGRDYGFFVEVSPHPVLTLALKETFESAKRDVAVVGTLRREDGDFARFLLSAGELHARGLAIDWASFFAPYGVRRVALPTYAFQRERFWLEAPRRRVADVVSAGQASAEHPLLAAVMPLAGGEGTLFTGRLSLADHAWLADHAVFGTAILPGTAFLELALLAAGHAGLDGVEELTLEAPLVLSSDGAVLLQMSVGAADGAGSRSVNIYSRTEDAPADAAWTRHASGMLAVAATAPSFDLRVWPPAGAEPVPIDGLYDRLAEAGFNYGPGFQGLQAMWRLGEDILAEAHLPEEMTEKGFGLHPALLDSALHALLAGQGAALPFSWRGVSQRGRAGALQLRVRFRRGEGEGCFGLFVADAAGEPVASAEALVLRPVTSDQVIGAAMSGSHQDGLFHLNWTTLPDAMSAVAPSRWAILGGEAFGIAGDRHADVAALRSALDEGAAALPDAVIVSFNAPAMTDPVAAHLSTAAALALLQGWIADARLAEVPLLIVTQRAVWVGGDEDVLDLSHAGLWGLVRTAQSENPGLPIYLIDSDGSEASRRSLVGTPDPEERQVALRAGRRLVPRLARPAAPSESASGRPLDPDGTVLITGGTGTLGGLMACHLVQRHGVKHLLLTSRQGAAAAGAEVLRGTLEGLGAEVTIAACDVSDRRALKAVLDGIAPAHPLTAVLHTAGVLDDGVLGALTPERLDRVLSPKIDAVWHLHELTREQDLAHFVLFSSVSGILGNSGQANYAAANVFLDALAQHRRALGLAATSLAWGYWAQASGMTSELGAADLQRMRRQGILPLSNEQGLALLDAGLQRPEATLVACRFDLSAATEAPPAMLRGLIRRRRVATNVHRDRSILERLRAMSEADRQQAILDLVRQEVATILRMDADEFEGGTSLFSYGFDSLMSMELRNRLQTMLSLKLSVVDVMGHASLDALLDLLADRLAREDCNRTASVATQSTDTSSRRAVTGNWVVIHRPVPSARMRLFCFPFAGGTAATFNGWPERLPAGVELCAIQSPGRHERLDESLPQTVEEMVAALVPVILPYLDKPFAMFGHCLGAIVMFELLRVLADQYGIRACQMFASGAPGPAQYVALTMTTRSREEFAEVLRYIGFTREEVLTDADVERHIFPAIRSDFEVAARYVFVPGKAIDVPVTTFSGREDPFAPPNVVESWRHITSSWSEHIVFPGEHYFIEPERDAVLNIISRDLELRIAAHEQEERVRAQPSQSVWIRPQMARDRARMRLFCFPGIGRGPEVYDRWSSWIGDEVEICTIELPGRGRRAAERPLGRVEEIVRHIVPALGGWLDLPFAMFGVDVGALTMFETVREFRRQGIELPRHLFVAAAVAPQTFYFQPMHRLPRKRLLAAFQTFGVAVDSSPEAEPALRAECAIAASYRYQEAPPLEVPVTSLWGKRDFLSPREGNIAWKHQTTKSYTFNEWNGSHDLVCDEVSETIDIIRETIHSRSIPERVPSRLIEEMSIA